MGFIRGLFLSFLIIIYSDVGFSQDSQQSPVTLLSTGTSFLNTIRATPDGKLVVFGLHGESDTNSEIYLFETETKNLINLTKSTASDSAPDISNDGNRVVFRSNRSGNYNLWIMEISTGVSKQLTFGETNATRPEFSPDGQWIAYGANLEGNWSIWVVNVESGETRPMTMNQGQEYRPSWSPDGKTIAFYTTWTDWTDLWTVSFPEGELTPILVSEREDYYPTWSNDGNWILFQSDRGNAGTDNHNWAVPAGGGEPFQLTSFPGFKTYMTQVGLTNRFLFTAEERKTQIFKKALKPGNEPTQLTKTVGFNEHPQISPDGNSIVFSSTRALDGNEQIYLMTSEGRDVTPLTAGRRFASRPVWDFSGKRIFFINGKGDPKDNDLWSLDVETGEETRVTNKGRIYGAVFCNSQEVLIVSGRDNDPDPIYLGKVFPVDGEIIKLDHLGKTISTKSPGFTHNPLDCAPDGTTLAFSAEENNKEALFQTQIEGGTPIALTSNDFDTAGAKWSPDGRYIAYSSNKNGNYDIFIKDLQTGETKQFTDSPLDEINPSWSPKGSALVYVVQDVRYAIKRVSVNLPELLSDGP